MRTKRAVYIVCDCYDAEQADENFCTFYFILCRTFSTHEVYFLITSRILRKIRNHESYDSVRNGIYRAFAKSLFDYK